MCHIQRLQRCRFNVLQLCPACCVHQDRCGARPLGSSQNMVRSGDVVQAIFFVVVLVEMQKGSSSRKEAQAYWHARQSISSSLE